MMTARVRLVHLLLLVPLLAAVCWLALRARSLRDDPADVLRALRASSGPALPEAASCGATLGGTPERYDRETLYEFIDGAADAYLARGFERCVAGTFASSTASGEPLEAAAEVYRFSTATGAAEQLAAERPAGAHEVVGTAGAVSDGTVLLAQSGRDLFKVTAFATHGEAAPMLEHLAACWRKEHPNG